MIFTRWSTIRIFIQDSFIHSTHLSVTHFVYRRKRDGKKIISFYKIKSTLIASCTAVQIHVSLMYELVFLCCVFYTFSFSFELVFSILIFIYLPSYKLSIKENGDFVESPLEIQNPVLVVPLLVAELFLLSCVNVNMILVQFDSQIDAFKINLVLIAFYFILIVKLSKKLKIKMFLWQL